MRDFSRLDAFLDDRKKDIGPSVLMARPKEFIEALINTFTQIVPIKDKVLIDIGCGLGDDLVYYKSLGAKPIGLTAIKDEGLAKNIEAHSLEVILGDQSFIPLEDDHVDVITARHVLEHSIFPYYTLTEYNRILKLKGFAYIEVPQPDTVADHEHNANHYSVLGLRMWRDLFYRCGFNILAEFNLHFHDKEDPAKPLVDSWVGFALQKTSVPMKPWVADVLGQEKVIYKGDYADLHKNPEYFPRKVAEAKLNETN